MRGVQREFRFPCADKRPLISVPLSGPLIHLVSQEKSKWDCWLCGKKNDKSSSSCSSCSRDAIPQWLVLPGDQSIQVGSNVAFRDNKSEYIGVVTQIDYLNKNVIAMCCEKNEPIIPIVIGQVDIFQGKLSLIQSNVQSVFCNYFLCGDCGYISKMANGKNLLDSSHGESEKKAKIRALDDEIHELQNKTRYLTRKWKETKAGFEDMTKSMKELERLQKASVRLKSELDPIQLWCSHCGWEPR